MTGTDGARLSSFPAPTWPTKAPGSGRKSEAKIIQSVTRNGESLKPAKQSSKTPGKGTRKTGRMPRQKRQAKPPSVTGYHWRKNTAGWELRKDIYVEENGVRKRKQPYVAHLSRSAFQEMKRRHKGAALEKAIAQWIADHDR